MDKRSISWARMGHNQVDAEISELQKQVKEIGVPAKVEKILTPAGSVSLMKPLGEFKAMVPLGTEYHGRHQIESALSGFIEELPKKRDSDEERKQKG